MLDTYELTTLEELRVLSDPVRLQILEEFGREPLTTKQVAKKVGISYTKLYHHIQLLEASGLIVVTKTVPNRGTIERYYESVAKHFHVDEKLLLLKSDGQAMDTLQGLLDGILSTTRKQFRASVAAGLLAPEHVEREGLVAQSTVRASREEIQELEASLNQWVERVRAANRSDGDSVYGLTVCFFPLVQEEGGRGGNKETGKREAKNENLKVD